MVPLIERELNATVIIATATDNSSENDILRRDANTECEIIVKKWRGEGQRCGVIVLAPIETRPGNQGGVESLILIFHVPHIKGKLYSIRWLLRHEL